MFSYIYILVSRVTFTNSNMCLVYFVLENLLNVLEYKEENLGVLQLVKEISPLPTTSNILLYVTLSSNSN